MEVDYVRLSYLGVLEEWDCWVRLDLVVGSVVAGVLFRLFLGRRLHHVLSMKNEKNVD